MNWIQKLQYKHFNGGQSQMGESKIISYIFDHLKPVQKFFVDIGAGFYGHGIMSNTNDLLKQGWDGIQVDANNDNDPNIKKLFITPDNILPAMAGWGVPKGFDLLTIDIDSFDIDILDKIVPEYRPRVICTEYNGTLDPDKSIKLKYEPGYIWDETNRYGYSFGAGVKFCNKYGYKIIYNHKNQNLFLVDAGLIGDVPVIKATQTHYHPWNENAEWVEYE